MAKIDKELRKDIKKEITVRKLVIKRLRSPLAHAQALGEKKRAERLARIAELSEYKSFNDAQEAYGFGCITEEEFDTIVDFLEHSEEMKQVKSAEEHAADLLAEFVNRLQTEIAGFEFELLPEKKQQEIRNKNFELLKRRNERRKAAERSI